ncbi:MAG: glycosyltransferase family 2 protein [Lachnospiraceae bacterium]|nr:glycosyltransferase family 2 protein [Lachnospiraceae bacterium]
MKLLVIFTCFNRKDKTEKCIRTLDDGNPSCEFTFVIADDNSSDGTQELLTSMQKEYDIHLLKGDGNLFYSGGMRMGMDYALKQFRTGYDYMIMMNDDVEFYDHCIEKMVEQSKEQHDSIVVGVMQDVDGQMSYSGVRYIKGIHYEKVPIGEWKQEVDTFNANCVMMPYAAFAKTGSIDHVYVHSLGDLDYGLALMKNGFKLHVSREYVGCCNNNDPTGSWTDTKLSRRERIKKKESVKGAPTKQWFYFLRKNFGILTAIRYTISPYVRIILGK